MPRIGLAFVLILLAAAVTTAHAGTITGDFGPTELGQIKTACARLIGPANIQTITVAPPYFVRGIRVGDVADGNQVCDNVPGLTTPAALPESIDGSQQLVFDIDLIPTQLGNFDEILTVNGEPVFDFTALVEPISGCIDSATANCLQSDRFKTRVHWRTNFGTQGAGPVVPASSDDSGLFYFFNADNWEVLLKVLDGCSINDRFWVFAAATTNVEYTITVTDTQEQEAVSYFKPQGPAAPAITDTAAFATCP